MNSSASTISQFIESLSQFVFRFDDPQTALEREEASNWIDSNVSTDDSEVCRLFEQAAASDLPLVRGYPLGFEEGEQALREISEFAVREDWPSWFSHFVASEASGLSRWRSEQR